MIVKFDYNINNDIRNYLVGLTAKNKSVQPRILNMFLDKYGAKHTEDDIRNFIINFSEKSQIKFNEIIIEFNNSWLTISDEFFSRMKNIFGDANMPNQITAYLSTSDRCTYSISDNLFFLFALTKTPLKIITHELLHFYTIYELKNEMSSLNDKQKYDFKETLTELLNLECADLIEAPDAGYQQHQELRRNFKNIWLENRDIKIAANNLIKLII